MKAFETYLHTEQLAASSISGIIKETERYLQWLRSEDIQEPELVNHSDILHHVQHLKDKGLQPQTINVRIGAVRKYYEHLKVQGQLLKNPVGRLHIKGRIKTVVEQPLSYSELQQLYADYVQYSKAKSYHLRSTVMLGLVVWQAADTHALKIMEPQHLQPETGMAYLPSSRRSNSRELPLDVKQILPAVHYHATLPQGQSTLIAGNVHNHLTHLIAELKGLNPVVRNLQHIRASVLLHWLKLYDKRRVQYMAGHKWISSTELYEQQETSVLDDQLRRYHPFG